MTHHSLRLDLGIEELNQMMKCYVDGTTDSDFKLDNRGRVTHKNDTLEEMETDSFLRVLFPLNDDNYLGEISCLFYMFTSEFCNGGIRAHSPLYIKIRECHKESKIDIPLYKILASLYVRYMENHLLPNIHEYEITYCDHVSSVDLTKYIGVLDRDCLIDTAIQLAYPEKYDSCERCTDGLLCEYSDYSDYCDLSAFKKLNVMNVMDQELREKHFKSDKDIEKEIFFPEECGLGYTLSNSFRFLLVITQNIYCKDGGMTHSAHTGQDSNTLYPHLKELLIEHLHDEEPEDIQFNEDEINHWIKFLNLECFKSSIPLVMNITQKRGQKNARKVVR